MSPPPTPSTVPATGKPLRPRRGIPVSLRTLAAILGILVASLAGWHALCASEVRRGGCTDEGEANQPAKRLDGRVFADDAERRRLAGMWSANVRERRVEITERETTAWRQVKSREEWERFRDQRMGALRRSLGEDMPVP